MSEVSIDLKIKKNKKNGDGNENKRQNDYLVEVLLPEKVWGPSMEISLSLVAGGEERTKKEEKKREKIKLIK